MTWREALACPSCKAPAQFSAAEVRCSRCGRSYPVVAGVPILIAEERSVFSAAMAVAPPPGASRLGRVAGKLLPSLGLSLVSEKNFARLRASLLQTAPAARVLILGAGERGAGVGALYGAPLEIVETDVFLGRETKVVADAHDLPFLEGSFDAVVTQALLEHVVDPGRCAAEAHRVLRPGGFVYSETPFMQQVHMGAHDFTRFTLGGHRALFRRFVEVDAGVCGGPAMALAWSIDHFFRSFSRSPGYRKALALTLPWAIFWIKYADLFLARRPGAADAASGTYFLGRRSEESASDRALLDRYRSSDR